jgi:selenocysteine lyase/cysteine desulfurase
VSATAAAPPLAALRRTPNALAADYARFDVANRLLLTGHSHQAWPDVARDAQLAAWDDAARDVDDKWTRAFARADRVRAGFARRLGCAPAEVALGTSTHELLVRFLSALPLATRPRLVTTDAEFHTIRRQLGRLAEACVVEVVKVAADPVDTLAARLAAETSDRVAAVLVSSVLFTNGRTVPGLGELAGACSASGCELLVDAYHHLNVVPFDLATLGLASAFVTGGGYKYCQLGEGNGFLRVPSTSELFPVVTGWFSEFGALSDRPAGTVAFGAGPARWAGATYDPVSHYRGARVFEWFDERGLTPEFLRAVSQHQVGRLAERFDALGLDPRVVTRDRATPLDGVAGFLALVSPHAGELSRRLRARGVHTDFRADVLRLGPAPYLSDAQLDAAIAALGEATADLG